MRMRIDHLLLLLLLVVLEMQIITARCGRMAITRSKVRSFIEIIFIQFVIGTFLGLGANNAFRRDERTNEHVIGDRQDDDDALPIDR